MSPEKRAILRELSDSNIVSYDVRKQFETTQAQDKIFSAAFKSAVGQGMSEDEAAAQAEQAVTDSGIGSITPNIDRRKAENRRLAEQRQAAAPPDDKFTRQGFMKDVDRSMTFGEESALLTPEGRQRALKQAVKSGYSFGEADTMVQGAFKKLQEIGKRDKVPIVVPPLPARPEDKGTTTTTAEPTPKSPAEPKLMVDEVMNYFTQPAPAPANMGKPTGPPTPATAVPVEMSVGTVWTDKSGHTYPYKPKPYDPEEYGFVSGTEMWTGTGLPKAWSDLKSSASNVAQGYMSEYKKAKEESPTTPLRSVTKGAWESLMRSLPNKQWWTQGL
jgi:hypothetical protein